MEQVILSDIILTANGLGQLQNTNWGRTFFYSEENYFFSKRLYVNPQSLDIYDAYCRNTEPVIISFKSDVLLRILDMSFNWENSALKIKENTDLGELLSAYLLLQFEKVGYRSFKESMTLKNISDYKYCKDYIYERSKFYNVEPPDIPIYLMSSDLWDILMGETLASYYPGSEMVVTSNKQWLSLNWFESLLVHEFAHAIQRKKGWFFSFKDLQLPNTDVDVAEKLFEQGLDIKQTAEIMQLDADIIKKLAIILNMKRNYINSYLDLPLELLAFSEQFRFLQWLGIPPSKIYDHITSYIESLDLSLSSRNKGLFKIMIHNSDEIISQNIKNQEAINDNPLSSWKKTISPDTSSPTR